MSTAVRALLLYDCFLHCMLAAEKSQNHRSLSRASCLPRPRRRRRMSSPFLMLDVRASRSFSQKLRVEPSILCVHKFCLLFVEACAAATAYNGSRIEHRKSGRPAYRIFPIAGRRITHHQQSSKRHEEASIVALSFPRAFPFSGCCFSVHEVVSHLGNTHVVMEAPMVALHRQLPKAHPVHALLAPHFEGTALINWGAHNASTVVRLVSVSVFVRYRPPTLLFLIFALPPPREKHSRRVSPSHCWDTTRARSTFETRAGVLPGLTRKTTAYKCVFGRNSGTRHASSSAPGGQVSKLNRRGTYIWGIRHSACCGGANGATSKRRRSEGFLRRTAPSFKPLKPPLFFDFSHFFSSSWRRPGEWTS